MAEENKSKGGKARAIKLSPGQRKSIAQTAAAARWGTERASHEGAIKIGNDGSEIPCAVLADGTRLITQGGFLKALGRAEKAKGGQGSTVDEAIPFLAARNLNVLISDDMRESTRPVRFITANGVKAFGYRAEILPQVCEIYLQARDQGTLHPSQLLIAKQAEILMRGLAHVGIISLIDEATGYQEVRNKEALQALLDAFLQKELAAWAKRFPDDFYKEIFRLRGWTWNRLSVKRPMFVGKLTNNIVYERLAPGILDELQNKNPKDERGRRKATHHQWLTEDVGHPALAQHLHAVIGLMRASSTWDQFMNLLERAFPKKGSVLQIEMFDDL